MFSAQIYATRRDRLKNDVGNGLILLLGNDEVGMNYRDNTLRYRQDSSFLYFFGLDRPGLTAIIDTENATETIFGHENTLDDIIWSGPQPSLSELAARVGVAQVRPAATIVDVLQTAQTAGRSIHFLPPYRQTNALKLHEWIGVSFFEMKTKASEKLIKAIIGQRAIKSDEEVLQLEEAVNISGEMHLAAMQRTRDGMYEYEIVGHIQGAALSRGGDLAYPIIFSTNGQTLHNHFHGNIMESGRLVLGDFGAENAMHYAGDITRTIPVDKKFTAMQREIYDIVLEMEMQSIAALQPGVQYREVHLAANRIMLDGLKQLGIVNGDLDEMLQLGVGGLFMPHGLGHSIGLDVHDMEDLGENYVGYRDGLPRSTQLGLRSLRFAKELEIGNTLTVEPGIYFIPELIDKLRAEAQFLDFVNYQQLEEYRTFGGIRIEDNCLITNDGSRVLGTPIPKTINEIETVRSL